MVVAAAFFHTLLERLVMKYLRSLETLPFRRRGAAVNVPLDAAVQGVVTGKPSDSTLTGRS
jgi:hypothetical protein